MFGSKARMIKALESQLELSEQNKKDYLAFIREARKILSAEEGTDILAEIRAVVTDLHKVMGELDQANIVITELNRVKNKKPAKKKK